MRWKSFSLVSWLCWESLCALSELPAQQGNAVGMGFATSHEVSLIDRRYFRAGNAAVGVGDMALNEK